MHQLQRGIIAIHTEHTTGKRYEISATYKEYKEMCSKVTAGKPLEFVDPPGHPTYIPAANVQGMTFVPLR